MPYLFGERPFVSVEVGRRFGVAYRAPGKGCFRRDCTCAWEGQDYWGGDGVYARLAVEGWRKRAAGRVCNWDENELVALDMVERLCSVGLGGMGLRMWNGAGVIWRFWTGVSRVSKIVNINS